MDFTIPADYCVKIKGIKMINKYLDLVKELKKLQNMKVIVIPNAVGALGIIPKGLEIDWMNWRSEEELRTSRT